jgi:hypothetical protein
MKTIVKLGIAKIAMPLFLIANLSITCYAKSVSYQWDTRGEKNVKQSRKCHDTQLTLMPLGDMYYFAAKRNDENIIELLSPSIQVYFGTNIDGKGDPFAVIQTSGKGVYRLFVISIGKHAEVLNSLENKYGFWISNDSDGRTIQICTADGAFYKDKEICKIYRYELIVPTVFLGMKENKFVDETPRATKYCDSVVKATRDVLSAKEIDGFRDRKIKDEFSRGVIKGRILQIVLAYLYAGQEAKAQETLDKSWPPADKIRIWNWALNKRANGILRKIR